MRSSCLGSTKKTAREGARHRLAPGSAWGTRIAGRMRGREGGRYNRREAIASPSPLSIPALVVAAFAATNTGIRSFPGRSPGLCCVARLRARMHTASHYIARFLARLHTALSFRMCQLGSCLEMPAKGACAARSSESGSPDPQLPDAHVRQLSYRRTNSRRAWTSDDWGSGDPLSVRCARRLRHALALYEAFF